MKKMFTLIALAFLAVAGFSQNGNAYGQSNGNSGNLVVSEFKIESGTGDAELITLRVSGQGAAEVQSLTLEPAIGNRISTIPMTKASAGGNGNGSTSLWQVEVDVEQMMDNAGYVEMTARIAPPWVALIVKSKPQPR